MYVARVRALAVHSFTTFVLFEWTCCDLTVLFIVAMEFSVGDSVEAVDQLGIWTKAKVVSKSDNAIVVNFPPWRAVLC